MRSFCLPSRESYCSVWVIKNDNSRGGTGWTVQLALDANKTVYVYDTNSNAWYQPIHYRWNEKGEWVKEFYLAPIGYSSWPGHELSMRSYPTLHKISAIVGSRTISVETRNEIRQLFRRTLAKENKALCPALDDCSLANNYEEWVLFFRCRPRFPLVSLTGSSEPSLELKTHKRHH